jgi:hypothetical protein
MAHGKYITAFERDVIRIGVAHGCSLPEIARFLHRNRVAIYNHKRAMEAEGTLGDLPFGFVCQEIAGAIKAKGRADG